jgi:2-keto-4-pentenoate hydratase/2-oxohepta-3-ene-1,7-dioic acid hydratase in catechol pathway
MKLAAVKPNDLAVIRDDAMVLVGDKLATEGVLPKGASMIDLIIHYDSIKCLLAKMMEEGPVVKLKPQQFKAPIERPSKIWAAAGNYKRGTSDLEKSQGRGEAGITTPEEKLERIFLKPPSSIIGPEEEIVIPQGAETIFPELELCIVIGKEVRNLSKEQAMSAVFGYTIILDVTARGYGAGKGSHGTRCIRKGFDTFAPLGPSITTADEIRDPHDLSLRLWVNGELRQSAKTDSMINNVVALISFLSQVCTLYPGDLIATGTPDAPAFQQKLVAGDRLTAEIEGIGKMNVMVGKANH